MSMRQSLFLFDYEGFKRAANPLVAALENGNPGPLQDAVDSVRQEIPGANKPIFDEVGIPLGGELRASRESMHLQATWGRWLLVVMSRFLSPAPSLEYKWSDFLGVLGYIGWSSQDQQEFIRGLPTTWLIKPQAQHPYDMLIKHDMPFWYWVRPVQCTYCGWLSAEKAANISAHLEADGSRIPGLGNITVSLGVTLAASDIRNMFETVIHTLNTAIAAEIGLFSVIYIGEG